MTPDEEVKISQKQKSLERASWIIAIPVGLVIASTVIGFMWALGDTKIYLGELVWPIVLVSFAISSFWPAAYIGSIWKENWVGA